MYEDFIIAPFLNLTLYLPLITIFFAILTLGKAIEGTQLRTVYLITSLMIIQQISDLIVTSVWNCEEDDHDDIFHVILNCLSHK